jgi:mannose-6-phosphate isomerase
MAGVKRGWTGRSVPGVQVPDYDAVMPRYPSTTGDTVYVPGGVIHSFGRILDLRGAADLPTLDRA